MNTADGQPADLLADGSTIEMVFPTRLATAPDYAGPRGFSAPIASKGGRNGTYCVVLEQGSPAPTAGSFNKYLGRGSTPSHDAAGRTCGTKGSDVTSKFKFNQDLASKRVALGAGATPAAIRQFCLDYLVQSMKDDVAAMKAVALDDSNYTDMSGMSAGDKTTYKAKVKAQIDTGENQILATEASIRTYDQ
jgi:hypothetical protein